MLKRFTFWLWAAVCFQLLTAAVHSLSLVTGPVPQNETERQIFDLMASYELDAGGGFHPSIRNLTTALSSCFTLLCLLGGLTNTHLLRVKAAANLTKDLVRIQILVFGICFIIMAVLTFPPPIVLSGLIVLTLAAAQFAPSSQTR